MKIEVKKSHIRRGRQGDCLRCPVALAVEEATKEYVAAFPGYLQFGEEWRNRVDFRVPKKVRTFIIRFDGEQKVKPFSFVIPDALIARLRG
jgi:hypothetical protein